MTGHPILGWLLIGMIAGVVAKPLMPRPDPGGGVVTILIGIAGALLAGFVAPAAGVQLGAGWPAQALAAVGAVVLLLLYRWTMAKRSR